ncbi:MAG: hypothetical protein LQ348_004931 [Seirophora lacunosa]|nr:MAG: hypothetical protein LQ344_003521 [Seirophora lacunosa]KAI4181929.1 MAG: hypothetical protein LQ348_004931 [Seirophora lacunosa]
MPRQPRSSDFEANLQLAIIPPLADQPSVNVLIFFHGLGDTKDSFAQLAQQLKLPETVCICLQAPSPLPFDLGGFHWGDDITFDQLTETMDYDTGFEKSYRIISQEIVEKVLLGKCEYNPRNILFFGFGQGGMAAIAATLIFKNELGGVVSIGGPLPSSLLGTNNDNESKNQTPIIVLGGASGSLITQSALTSLKRVFNAVEYVKWPREGDGMPRNREEMIPVMKFLARRLQSKSGVPQDATEVI